MARENVMVKALSGDKKKKKKRAWFRRYVAIKKNVIVQVLDGEK